MEKLFTGMIIALLLGTLVAFPQKRKSSIDIRAKSTEQLVKDFTSGDWGGRVVPAERELESRQALVIPEVMELVDKDEKVELQNTWDLIYPGAKKFYGHGWVLDYDVDWISARVGWLLEELTFQDFGFRDGVIDHDEVMKAVINGKSDSYINDLKAKLKGQDTKKQARILAVQKAKDWFQREGKSWNRFDAVVHGLRGTDVALQYRILQWLRNRETRCDGLTLATFERSVLPEVSRLSKSPNEGIRDEANYLIEDNSNRKWWYRRKLKRDFPDTYTSIELK